jgi:hypothetical protein
MIKAGNVVSLTADAVGDSVKQGRFAQALAVTSAPTSSVKVQETQLNLALPANVLQLSQIAALARVKLLAARMIEEQTAAAAEGSQPNAAALVGTQPTAEDKTK